MFEKFYNVISNKLDLDKGQFISLAREIGKHNFVKYLNLELKEQKLSLELINEDWFLIIVGPIVSEPYRFIINKLKMKGNKTFRDNLKDPGNPEILTYFLNYIENKLGFKREHSKKEKLIKTQEIIDREKKVQAIFDIIKDLLERANSHSCYGKEGYTCWQLDWNAPTPNYVSERRKLLKSFSDELKYLFLDKENPLVIYGGRYKIEDKELLIDSAFHRTGIFEDNKKMILNDLKEFCKKMFDIDLI